METHQLDCCGNPVIEFHIKCEGGNFDAFGKICPICRDAVFDPITYTPEIYFPNYSPSELVFEEIKSVIIKHKDQSICDLPSEIMKKLGFFGCKIKINCL